MILIYIKIIKYRYELYKRYLLNEKITNRDYQKLNNVNRDKALSELKGLISKGIIKTSGVGSGTCYVLNEDRVSFEKAIQQMFDIEETSKEIAGKDIKSPEQTEEIAGRDTKSPDSNGEIAGTDIKSPEQTEEIAGKTIKSPETSEETSGNNVEILDNEDLVIKYILDNGKITNKEVREITGLKESSARDLLAKMVNDQKLNPMGKNRGRYYIVN